MINIFMHTVYIFINQSSTKCANLSINSNSKLNVYTHSYNFCHFFNTFIHSKYNCVSLGEESLIKVSIL